MIKPVVTDVFFLRQPSELASDCPEDRQTIRDLLDTLAANRDACVGMAANMIGVRKQIMVVNAGFVDFILVNPVITAKDSPYETEEGCLSLTGVRPATRYENITVEYLDHNFNKMTRQFSGFIAQIIQHELDHFSGIII
jgi:peptide deformylase